MRTPHTMPRHRRVAALLAASALLLCPQPAGSDDSGARYELTLRNTNDGQNFSPPVIILHTGAYRLFEPGEPASAALWRLAEDGATAGFEDLAGGEQGVRGVILGASLHRRNSPVFTTRVEAPGDSLVSVAAMLSLTNDGFVAERAVPLPDRVGAGVTVALRAYDAGSEANTELCAHVPCETHGRRMTVGAEGSVAEHPGIRGDADIPVGRAWTAAPSWVRSPSRGSPSRYRLARGGITTRRTAE